MALQNSGSTSVQSLNPLARLVGGSPANGTGVDTAKRQWVDVKFDMGALTDGTHTPKIQESDDNSAFNDVAAGDQIGTLAVLATNVAQSARYKGGKRYVRPVITSSGTTTGAIIGATVVLGPNNEG